MLRGRNSPRNRQGFRCEILRLAGIFAEFTEGFAFPDLVTARTLLDA
jgi:hypothetical protein